MNGVQSRRVIRFGPFEADLHTRELRKHGLRLKLQEQPFQVLAMLLARPGELVTRDEIRSALWPQDTFIDFDHGLNAAVRRLRDALNDKAETPRFVETLPRRGYRFIGSVEKLGIEVQPETGVLASPTVAIEGATEAGAGPAQEIAQQKVVDHQRETESEVTIAAESGAAVAETEMPPTSTRQTARPSASILPQLISQ